MAKESRSFDQTLQKINSDFSQVERMEGYKVLYTKIKPSTPQDINLDTTTFENTILTDIASEDHDLAHIALQCLGNYLHSRVGLSSSNADLKALDALIALLDSTTKRQICTHALWCLVQQRLPAPALSSKVAEIVKVTEKALYHKSFNSQAVEYDCLCVIDRLLEQIPEAMSEHTVRWGRMVYPMLVHGVEQVRERGIATVNKGMKFLLNHQQQLAPHIREDLLNMLLKEMTRLMDNHQGVSMLQAWQCYLKLIGKIDQSSFLNKLLIVPEKGFKDHSYKVKIAAYMAWGTLIDSFAMDPATFFTDKKMKLVMSVFILNNAKTEEMAKQKLLTWWYLIQKLGPSAHVFMDKVIAPLLTYCIGVQNEQKSAATVFKSPPHKLQNATSPSSKRSPHLQPQLEFKIIRELACEVVSLILCKGLANDQPHMSLTLEPLEHEIVTGTNFFAKHATFLIEASKLCMMRCPHHPLGLTIWTALVSRVRSLLESSRKEGSAAFTALLACLQKLFLGGAFTVEDSLEVLGAAMSLPKRSLASSVYSIPLTPSDTTDTMCASPHRHTAHTSMMHTNPVTLVTHLLLQPSVIQHWAQSKQFLQLYSSVLKCGFSNESLGLGFCQKTIQLFEKLKLDIEILCDMWIQLATQLIALVNKTDEVNQGDALEHDFTCMNLMLMFPITHLVSTQLKQKSRSGMLDVWGELYQAHARCAAAVTSVQANIALKEVVEKIHLDVTVEKLQDDHVLESMCVMAKHMVDAVEFSSLAKSVSFAGITSPLSPGGKRSRVLGHLDSYVGLISLLVTAHHNVTDGSDKKLLDSMMHSATALVHILTTLFTKITLSNLVRVLLEKLAKQIAGFYERSATRARRYSPTLNNQLDSLWGTICASIRDHCNGLYDSDFLLLISPLLSTTFIHPRSNVKNQTLSLWNATFSHTSTLTYPEDLQGTLVKVKEATVISLPGWNADSVKVDENLQCLPSMSQVTSEFAPPAQIQFNSPKKMVFGSMLHSSPDKRHLSPAVKHKQVALEDMDTQDFVEIKTPERKGKRLLTDHQKEVLRSRKVIPAMYNALDASQDVSQFESQISLESQSNQSSLSPAKNSPIKSSLFDKKGEDVKTNAQFKVPSFQEAKLTRSASKDDSDQQSDSSTSSVGSNSKARRRSLRFSKAVASRETPAKLDTEKDIGSLQAQKNEDPIIVSDSQEANELDSPVNSSDRLENSTNPSPGKSKNTIANEDKTNTSLNIFENVMSTPSKLATNSPRKSVRLNSKEGKYSTPNKWLSKSTHKPIVEPMRALTVALVEDTEQFSPKKFLRLSQSSKSSETDDSEEKISETPVKESNTQSQLDLTPDTKKCLFKEDGDKIDVLSPEISVVKKSDSEEGFHSLFSSQNGASPLAKSQSSFQESLENSPRTRSANRKGSPFFKLSKIGRRNSLRQPITEIDINDIIPDSQDCDSFSQKVQHENHCANLWNSGNKVATSSFADIDTENSDATSDSIIKPRRRSQRQSRKPAKLRDLPDCTESKTSSSAQRKLNEPDISSDDDTPLSQLSFSKKSGTGLVRESAEHKEASKEIEQCKSSSACHSGVSNFDDNIPLTDLLQLKQQNTDELDFSQDDDSQSLIRSRSQAPEIKTLDKVTRSVEREQAKLRIDMKTHPTTARLKARVWQTPPVKRLTKATLKSKVKKGPRKNLSVSEIEQTVHSNDLNVLEIDTIKDAADTEADGNTATNEGKSMSSKPNAPSNSAELILDSEDSETTTQACDMVVDEIMDIEDEKSMTAKRSETSLISDHSEKDDGVCEQECVTPNADVEMSDNQSDMDKDIDAISEDVLVEKDQKSETNNNIKCSSTEGNSQNESVDVADTSDKLCSEACVVDSSNKTVDSNNKTDNSSNKTDDRSDKTDDRSDKTVDSSDKTVIEDVCSNTGTTPSPTDDTVELEPDTGAEDNTVSDVCSVDRTVVSDTVVEDSVDTNVSFGDKTVVADSGKGTVIVDCIINDSVATTPSSGDKIVDDNTAIDVDSDHKSATADSAIDEVVATNSSTTSDTTVIAADIEPTSTTDVVVSVPSNVDGMSNATDDIKDEKTEQTKCSPMPFSRARMILERSQKARFSKKENIDPASDDNLDLSPPRSPKKVQRRDSPNFRTVRVMHVYSPSASPSAGILKRRLSDHAMDSPSPPTKNRRVSFSNSVKMRLHPPRRHKYPVSPKPVNRCLEMAKNQKMGPPSILKSSPKITCAKESEVTRDVQQLTLAEAMEKLSSLTWYSELTSLIEKRRLQTVTELLHLQECDIISLPVDIETYRTAMKEALEVQKDQPTLDSVKTEEDSAVSPLPSADAELEKMSSTADMKREKCDSTKLLAQVECLESNMTDLISLDVADLMSTHAALNRMMLQVVSAIKDKSICEK